MAVAHQRRWVGCAVGRIEDVRVGGIPIQHRVTYPDFLHPAVEALRQKAL